MTTILLFQVAVHTGDKAWALHRLIAFKTVSVEILLNGFRNLSLLRRALRAPAFLKGKNNELSIDCV